MIVFTFSSTTDSAESLLTMSLKSTYYPKPISGSRLFVEPNARYTYCRSFRCGFFFSFKISYKDLLTLLKDIAVIFIRRHFIQTIEIAITLTGQMLWSGWQTSQFGDTNNGTLKENISTKYTFILPAQCVKCQTSYFLREVRAQAARKNQVAGQFLFYLLSALQCTNFSRIDELVLLTISCSLRSIKIRSVRRVVPTSCKPSNYGYNRHHVAHWTAPSIRSKTSEREFPLPWNFSRVCPPRKYSSPADVISSKVSVSFSLYQGRENTLVFPSTPFRISFDENQTVATDVTNVRLTIDLVHSRIDLARCRRASDRSTLRGSL